MTRHRGGPDRSGKVVGGQINNGNGHVRRRGPERAIIASVRRKSQRKWEVEESIEELAGLAAAAGATVVDRVIQDRDSPSPALYFGKGKVEEVGERAAELKANVFISDDELSPIQERNLSEALGNKVIDRTALALCYDRGRVLTRADEAAHVRLRLELPHDVVAGLAPYRVSG